MNKILAFIILFSSAAMAAGVPGSPTGTVTSAEAANVVSPATTINAQCASPVPSGCSAGQFVSLKLGGRRSITAHVVHSGFTSGWSAYVSTDNGVTWSGAVPHKSTIAAVAAAVTQTNVAGSSATIEYAILLPYPAVTDVMFTAVTAVTGSAVVTLIASEAPPNLMVLATGKGNQALSGAGLSTQDIKDSGRSYVVFSADGVTPAVSETVITFTKTIADTQTTGQTTYTITNLKTLRIQAICASATMGAAANRIRVALRLNTGGACIAGSNILLPVLELAPNFGTATAAEGGANGCVPIPDGLEIAGNGTKAICLSEAATAASGTLTVNLIGYEY
jgi:hypothetical protein